MKKLLMAFLILSVVLLVGACTVHKHTFSTEWSYDENNHWHAATCEHTDSVSDEEAHEYNSVVTTEATCTTKGVKTLTCKVCGYEKTEEIAVVDHSWDSGVVTTEPTCTTVGVKTFTCSVCSETKEEDLPALGHAHGSEWISDDTNHWHACSCGDISDEAAHISNDGVVTTNPTCESKGVKTYSCTVCEKVLRTEELDYGDHVSNEGVVTTNPTCNTKGVKTYSCTECGEVIRTEELEYGDHSYGEPVVVEATCKEKGSKTTTCTVCGDTKVEDLPIVDHSYGEPVVVEATCKEKGSKTTTCTVCGDTKVEDLPIVDHSYGEPVVVEATCKEKGSKTTICTVCGDTQVEELPMVDHVSNEGVVTTKATCKNKGLMTYSCTNCGEVLSTEELPIVDHVSDEGVVTTEATCENKGLMTYSCLECNEVLRTEEIDCVPHIYPSYTNQNGYSTATCSVCGHEYKEAYLTCTVWQGIDTNSISCVQNNNGTFTVSFTTTGRYGEFVLVYGDNKLTNTSLTTISGNYRSNPWFDDLANYVYYEKGGSQGECWVAFDFDGVDIPHAFAIVFNPTENSMVVHMIDQATCEHNWNNGEVTTVPTCTEKGVKTYTCTICCLTKTEEVDVDLTNHTYSEEWSHNEASHYHECECGAKSPEISHKWNDGEVTTEATCKAEGVKTYTCTVCETTKTEKVDVVDHVSDEGTVTTEPTCKVEGVKTYKCSSCGEVIKTEKVAVIDHTSDEGEITTVANCQTKGVKTYKCNSCGDVLKTEELEYGDHVLGEDAVVVNPTCTSKGSRTFTCTLCGTAISEELEIDPNAHTHSTEWSKNDTHHWHECACGNKGDEAEHTWNSGDVTTEAKCNVTGIMTYTCTECGATKEESIPEDETKHSWGEGEVTSEPTCSEEGIKTYTCSVCGDTKTEAIEPDASKHVYTDKWHSDDENHWHECECGAKDTAIAHTWDEGKVYNDISNVYTCTVCSHKKYDVTNDDLTAGIDSEKYGLAIRVPEDRDIKVLQLADVHFGNDTRNWHNNKIERTKAYITTMIEEQKPDLIVCSGDNIIGTGILNNNVNEHDLTEFCTFIDSFGIPWTFMYGNHDAETKVKSEYSEQLLAWIADGTLDYLLYQEEYVEEADTSFSTSDEGRYGNFSIQVLNPMGDKLLGALIFFDAGTYLYDLGYYQSHTEGQVAWYEQKIEDLQAIYSAQEGNLHATIPTIVFTHIQLPEHDKAYNQAYYHPENTDYEFVIRQDSLASSFTDEAMEKLDPDTDNGLFNKMVELGSTKAVFVGHAHTHDFQVKSHGIVLGYGPQTGFSKVFDNNENPRHTYMYNVSNDFSFTTTSIEEEYEEPTGFNYTYTSVNDNTELDRYSFNYDEEKGVYYGIVYMAAWSKIKLRYNGTVLTPENTTIVGDYNPTSVSYKLYTPASREYYMSNVNCDYAFIYDPNTNTLTIHDVRGLSYSGTNSGEAVYDIFTDTYTITNKLAHWNFVSFTYGDTALNPENTTFDGYYYNGGDTATVRLYNSDSVANTYVNGHLTSVTYKITLNATTNTLYVDVINVNGIDLDADSGLVYTGFRTGTAEYDEASGTYSYAASYKAWGRSELFYNGELIYPFDSEKVELINNANISSSAVETTLMNGSLPKAYKFTFTPATDDAKIKLVVDNASTAIDKNNADGGADSVAVWTTAGTELKSVTDTSNGTSTWIGNGWRVYIVCDAEGKIAYMVQHPVSGYGGPSGNGYYCHSSYSSDYKTNPAFNILDGYGPWVSGGYVHNLYEVKVPEGGFAITAHGAGVYELYDLLGIDYSNLPEDDPDTTKDEYTNALLNLVNSRTVLGDNIRLSYDSNYNIVIVSK